MKLLKLFWIRNSLFLFLSIIFSFFIYLFIEIYSFLYLNSFVIFIVISTILTILLFAYLFLISRMGLVNKVKILSFLEEKLFSKRKFILDTYVELKSKKGRSFKEANIMKNIEERIRSLDVFVPLFRKVVFQVFLISSVIMLIIIGAVPITFHLAGNVKKKSNEIISFINEKSFNINIPEIYIKGKELPIRIEKLDRVDRWVIRISNSIFEVEKENFIVPIKFTTLDKFHITIYFEKFGIRKIVFDKTLYGVDRFLPLYVSQTVYYPNSLMDKESINSFGDIEVYPGAEILLFGKMSRNIKELRMNFQSVYSIKNDAEFKVLISPKRSGNVKLGLISTDGDEFYFPEWNIEIKHNRRPELKIIFPQGEVVLKNFPWSVSSIVEGNDEQGIYKILVDCIVSNENKRLSFLSQKKRFAFEYKISKSIYEKFTFTSSDIELLPGDRAEFRFVAYDLFNSLSKPVSFYIYAPDFDWLEKNFQKSLKLISNVISSIEEKYSDEELSELEREKLLKEISNLSEEISNLNELSGNEEEVLETLSLLKETLNKFSHFIKGKDEFLNPIENKNIKEANIEFENLKEYLWQLNKLMDLLNMQKESLRKKDVISKLEEMLGRIENSESEEGFKRSLSFYTALIEEEMVKSEKDDKELLRELLNESKKIKFGDERSFSRSRELINILKERYDENKSKDREKALNFLKQTVIYLIEEIILNSILVDEAINDFNIMLGIYNNFDKIVIYAKTISSSIKNIENIYRNKLGIFFIFNERYYEVLSIISSLYKKVSYLQDNLREKYYLGCHNGFIEVRQEFYYLYEAMKSFLDTSMEMTGDEKESGHMISMNKLIQMQKLITEGIEKMLKEAPDSEEFQKLENELSALQKEIMEKLNQLSREGYLTGGKDVQGEMEKVLEDIREEKITEKTLERSKRLEEKLLKSQSGLKAKGLENERRAERPKSFEVVPPPNLFIKPESKKEIFELTNRTLPYYYRILLEKYKSVKDKYF